MGGEQHMLPNPNIRTLYYKTTYNTLRTLWRAQSPAHPYGEWRVCAKHTRTLSWLCNLTITETASLVDVMSTIAEREVAVAGSLGSTRRTDLTGPEGVEDRGGGGRGSVGGGFWQLTPRLPLQALVVLPFPA
jgi:hypothetical protein